MIRIVGFSGGIDSQAAAIWVRNHYPDDEIILINTEAGRNESQITREFVKNYSENIFPVTEVVPLIKDLWKTEGFAETKGFDGDAELTFKGLIQIKGRAPSRTRQFCTTFLKLEPMKRWIEENIDDEFERYSGVRRDESEARKDVPFRYFDEYFDCYANNPLADWTKKMCFDYVVAHGEEYNPLYKLGFGRVGCAPCINSGKDDILLWSQRFPEMIGKIREYEQEAGCTFFAPCVPGMKMNNIDNVLEWASTGRGGRQQDIIKLHEECPACESKFGLCE